MTSNATSGAIQRKSAPPRPFGSRAVTRAAGGPATGGIIGFVGFVGFVVLVGVPP